MVMDAFSTQGNLFKQKKNKQTNKTGQNFELLNNIKS